MKLYHGISYMQNHPICKKSVFLTQLAAFVYILGNLCQVHTTQFSTNQRVDKSLTNALNRRQIGARSWVTIKQCELSKTRSEGNHRCIADTREILGMLNIRSCRQFKIMLCEWVLTEKYISDDLQPMREQDTRQREVRGGRFFSLLSD